MSAHAMPLVAQATGVQAKRKARVDRFGHRLVRRIDKMRAPARSRENPVFVKSLPAGRGAGRIRPLLRALFGQNRVRQAGDIEVASARRFAVFVPDRFGAIVSKQRLVPTQQFFQPLRKIDHDLPVMARFAGTGNCRVEARNPAFGIGHRAFFFTP
jgi:hypothetical protein